MHKGTDHGVPGLDTPRRKEPHLDFHSAGARPRSAAQQAQPVSLATTSRPRDTAQRASIDAGLNL